MSTKSKMYRYLPSRKKNHKRVSFDIVLEPYKVNQKVYIFLLELNELMTHIRKITPFGAENITLAMYYSDDKNIYNGALCKRMKLYLYDKGSLQKPEAPNLPDHVTTPIKQKLDKFYNRPGDTFAKERAMKIELGTATRKRKLGRYYTLSKSTELMVDSYLMYRIAAHYKEGGGTCGDHADITLGAVMHHAPALLKLMGDRHVIKYYSKIDHEFVVISPNPPGGNVGEGIMLDSWLCIQPAILFKHSMWHDARRPNGGNQVVGHYKLSKLATVARMVGGNPMRFGYPKFFEKMRNRTTYNFVIRDRCKPFYEKKVEEAKEDVKNRKKNKHYESQINAWGNCVGLGRMYYDNYTAHPFEDTVKQWEAIRGNLAWGNKVKLKFRKKGKRR